MKESSSLSLVLLCLSRIPSTRAGGRAEGLIQCPPTTPLYVLRPANHAPIQYTAYPANWDNDFGNQAYPAKIVLRLMEPSQMRSPICSNLRSYLTGDPSHSSILQASAFIHAPMEMPRPHLSSETGCVSLCSVRDYCSRRSVGGRHSLGDLPFFSRSY